MPSGKQGNLKKKACIFKETFANVSICCPVSQAQRKKSDTPYTDNQFWNAPVSRQKQEWNLLQPNNFGRFQNSTKHCYNCGELGHWKHNCPKKNIIQELEVNHNRIDKTETNIKDKYFDLFDCL